MMMQQEIHREEQRKKELSLRHEEEKRRQLDEKIRMEERKADREHQQLMQSMFMSVMSSSFRSPHQTNANVSNASPFRTPSPLVGCSVTQSNRSPGTNSESAGQSHAISYPVNPVGYHELKYNNWSPSSCSTCSNSPETSSQTNNDCACANKLECECVVSNTEHTSCKCNCNLSISNECMPNLCYHDTTHDEFDFTQWFEQQLSNFRKR